MSAKRSRAPSRGKKRPMRRPKTALPWWLLLLAAPLWAWYFLWRPFQPALFLGVPLVAIPADNRELVSVHHGIYTSILDCRTRTPLLVAYPLAEDQGNAPRHDGYIDDWALALRFPHCHPKTDHGFKTYQSVLRRQGMHQQVDVGHLAMANHLDNNEHYMRLANQWSNLAPQSAIKNRQGGAWYATELVAECHRDIEPLLLLSGIHTPWPLTGSQPFMATFGQPMPQAWWRLIYWQQSNRYAIWWMPNDDSSSAAKLLAGDYSLTLPQLTQRLDYQLSLLPELERLGAQPASREFVRTTQQRGLLTCRGQQTDLS